MRGWGRGWLAVGAALATLVGPGFVRGVEAQSVVDQLLTTPKQVVGADPATTPNFGLELVGHSDLGARGNNSALALAGDCAYVGNRGFNGGASDGDDAPIAIVDITNPAAPTVAGSVPGSAPATATTRELRTIPDKHLLVVMTYEHFIDTQLTTADVDTLHLYDISNCFSPVLVSTFDLGPIKPHEFFIWEDHAHPGRALAYITTPFGPIQLVVVDLTNIQAPSLLTVWDGLYPQPSAQELDNSALGNYLHSLSLSDDGRTAYLAYWDGGYYAVDTSQLAEGRPHPIVGPVIPVAQVLGRGVNYTLRTNGNTHSAVPVPGRKLTILTDELYDGIGECPYGWLHVVDRSKVANPNITAEYRLPENSKAWCKTHVTRPLPLPPAVEGQISSDWVAPHDATWSSHNITVTRDLAVLAWHAGGLQIVDISNPKNPVQRAQFVPTPADQVACQSPVGQTDALKCQRPVPAALQQFFGNNNVLMWSYPIIRNGLIYVVDIRNGLFILRYTDPHFASELTTEGTQLEGNSNVTDPVITQGPPLTGPPTTVKLLDQVPGLLQRYLASPPPSNANAFLFCQL